MRHPASIVAKSVFALAIGAVLAISTATALARDAAARRIIGFSPSGKPAVIVVLLQRFSQGFEGRDRRFIAVTGQPR